MYLRLKQLSAIFVFFIVGWVVTTPVRAQNINVLSTVGQAATSCVVTEGNTVVTGSGSTIQIFSISENGTPLPLDRISANGYITDMILKSGILYVAEGSAGIGIYDCSSSESLCLLSQLMLSTEFNSGSGCCLVQRLALSGNTLIAGAGVSDGSEFLWTVDVSDPENPVERDALYSSMGAVCMVAQDNIVYVATNTNVLIYDVSNPNSITLVDTIDDSYGSSYPTDVRSMSIQGDTLFLLSSQGSKLVRMDISTPESPVFVSSCRFYDSDLNDIADILPWNDLLLTAEGDKGIFVRDIQNPARAPFLSGLDTGGYAAAIATNGTFIFTADEAGGLFVSTFPAKPDIHRTFKEILSGDAQLVSKDGNIAAVSSADGIVQFYDISTPDTPIRKGSFDAGGPIEDLNVHGSQTFITERADNLMLIVDTQDPDHPNLLGQYHPLSEGGLPLDVAGVAVSDTIAVITTYEFEYENEVHIVDISDPAHPALLGRYIRHMSDSVEYRTRPVIVNSTVYLPNSFDGFQILDISDPAHPALVKEITDYGTVNAVWKSGDTIALQGRKALYLLNVSSPQSPVREGTVSFPEDIQNVYFQGSHLTVNSYPKNILWYDLNNPNQPVLVGVYGMEAGLSSISGYTDCLAADGSGGFQVIHANSLDGPEYAGRYDQSVMSYDATAKDSILVSASGNEGIVLASILNPDHPAVLSRFPLPGSVYGVGRIGNTVIASGNNPNIYFVDISHPTEPSLITSLHFGPGHTATNPAYYVATEDNLAAVMSENSLQIFDLSDSSSPTPRGLLENFSYGASGLTWYGNYLYIACQSQGVKIVDCSDPDNLSVVNTINPSGTYPVDVAVNGQTLVVSNNSTGGIATYNLDDPTAPTELDQLVSGFPYRFWVHDNSVISLNQALTTFSTYDISNPSSISFGIYEEEALAGTGALNERTGVVTGTDRAGVVTLGAAHQLVTFSVDESTETRYWIPHVDWSAWWETHLVVDNSGNGAVNVSVQLYSDGVPEPVQQIQVPSGAQQVINLEEGQCGFVSCSGDATDIHFREVFISQEGGICEFPLHCGASPEISLPFPAGSFDSLTWRGLAVMNVEAEGNDVHMTAYSADGSILAEDELVIPAYSRMVGYIQDFFSGIAPESVARVRMVGTHHLSAIRISGHNNTQLLFTPSVNHFEAETGRYYITHIASEWNYWDNVLSISNWNSNDVSATLVLFNEAGETETVSLSISANATASVNLNDYQNFNPVCGYVDISDENVTIRQTYNYRSENGIAEFILRPGNSRELTFLFPGYGSDELTWQGLAICNVSSKNSTVTLRAFGSDGQLGSDRTVELEPHHRIADTLDGLFPGITGILRVTATGNASLTGLNISGMGHERLLFVPAVSN